MWFILENNFKKPEDATFICGCWESATWERSCDGVGLAGEKDTNGLAIYNGKQSDA